MHILIHLASLTKYASSTATKSSASSTATAPELVYFAAHSSPETSAKQKLIIHFQPAPRFTKLEEEFDFSTLEIKGRGANGNIIAVNPVKRIVLVR